MSRPLTRWIQSTDSWRLSLDSSTLSAVNERFLTVGPAFVVSWINDCEHWAKVIGFAVRGIMIISISCGSESRFFRKASRYKRLIRFLLTALPHLRDTDTPRRLRQRSFGAVYTNRYLSAKQQRLRYTRWKSSEVFSVVSDINRNTHLSSLHDSWNPSYLNHGNDLPFLPSRREI